MCAQTRSRFIGALTALIPHPAGDLRGSILDDWRGVEFHLLRPIRRACKRAIEREAVT